MWRGHNRLVELISEETCKDEIQSFLKHGQQHPVLGRRLPPGELHKVELIYGARRHFVACHLGVDLLVDLQHIEDRDAFIALEIENQLRRPLSPYERGLGYRAWIRDGYFKTQEEIAKTLGISKAQMSRLTKCAELPPCVVDLFGDPADLRESWGVALAQRCEHSDTRKRILAVAQSFKRKDAARSLKPAEVFDLLIHADSKHGQSSSRRDEVIRSQSGLPLCRISYRSTGVHIVLPVESATDETIKQVTAFLGKLLDSGSNLELRKALKTGRKVYGPARSVEKRRSSIARALGSMMQPNVLRTVPGVRDSKFHRTQGAIVETSVSE